MNIKKYLGIILVALGIILTLDGTSEFSGIIDYIIINTYNNWPLLLLVLGFYLLTNSGPKKRKSK